MLCNCNKIQYFNYHYTDNMSNNCFRTLEEAVDYLNEILDDDKQDIGDKVDICQLPPEETADLTDEEKLMTIFWKKLFLQMYAVNWLSQLT